VKARDRARAILDRLLISRGALLYCSRPAEKVLCPLLILVGASDPPYQLGRGDVLGLARRHTLAQRLQRVVNACIAAENVRAKLGRMTPRSAIA
jgi:hypothetical protein